MNYGHARLLITNLVVILPLVILSKHDASNTIMSIIYIQAPIFLWSLKSYGTTYNLGLCFCPRLNDVELYKLSYVV